MELKRTIILFLHVLALPQQSQKHGPYVRWQLSILTLFGSNNAIMTGHGYEYYW